MATLDKAAHPSLAEWVERRARETPRAIAYQSPHDSASWLDYHERSQRLARLLAAEGFGPGDRLAVLLPDGPGVHAAFLGIEKAGATTVGIGPRAGYAELHHLLKLTGATGLLTREHQRGESMRAIAAQLRRAGLPLRRHFVLRAEAPTAGARGLRGELGTDETIWVDDLEGRFTPSLPESDRDTSVIDDALRESWLGPEDWFLLNSTSGTTGMPKCVRHTQRRWMHFHELAVEAAELGPKDVFMSALPAPFGFGIWTAHVTPTLLGIAGRFATTLRLRSARRSTIQRQYRRSSNTMRVVQARCAVSASPSLGRGIALATPTGATRWSRAS